MSLKPYLLHFSSVKLQTVKRKLGNNIFLDTVKTPASYLTAKRFANQMLVTFQSLKVNKATTTPKYSKLETVVRITTPQIITIQ